MLQLLQKELFASTSDTVNNFGQTRETGIMDIVRISDCVKVSVTFTSNWTYHVH